MDDFKRWLKSESKFKLLIAGALIIGVLFIAFFNPRDADYLKAVAEEIEIAKQICMNSSSTVLNNMERLKLDNNKLDDIPVNGEIPNLKYVRTPKVIFMHNGYARAGSKKELYCTFPDPRGSNEFGSGTYFYDYEDRMWVGKTRTRR